MELHELNTNARTIALSSKSTITLKDGDERFTYQIKKTKDQRSPGHIWWVRLLCGPDNKNDYKYLCQYKEDLKLGSSPKSCAGYSSPSMQMFRRFIKHIDYLPNDLNTLKIYHSGDCIRCGRPLTVPESILSGLGPECRKHYR